MEEYSASAKIQQEADDLIKNEHQAGASSVIDITKMIKSLQPLPSSACCIYKVPDPLRKLNEEAYNPQVISIGPFHHGNKKLQTMENYKARYLKEFIERFEINMEDLKRAIKDLEESVRHCYAETISLSSDDFVTMILTDASFIIELFYRNRFNEWTSDDCVVLKPWLTTKMQLDFILLENQLPFFIIDKLFDIAFRSRSPRLPSFVELTFEYFYSYNRQERSLDPELEILHFADLLRNFYLPPRLPSRNPRIIEHMYTVTQLVAVGLKFEADRSSNCLVLDLDLDYKKGVLKIPCLNLDDETELYVRNILALEQCHYPNKAYVTDYFILLNFLLNDEKDLDVLRRQGILVNGFGNKHVTNFINNLGTGMIYSNMSSKYYDICIKLKMFYEEPGWLEYMRRNYFGTALRVVASTVTILTLIQTVCSIISIVPHH